MKARREFLKSVGLFLVAASCNPDKLLGPRCPPETPEIPEAPDDLSDVYVVDSFGGTQLGTKANPYAASTRQEFDGLLSILSFKENLRLNLSGRFTTQGAYRWGSLATRNIPATWTVRGPAEASLEPTRIDAQPLYVLAGGRGVSNITTIGNHSALADRWNAQGLSLRTGSVLLENGGTIDNQTASNFGSLGAESFIREIVGSGSITNSEFTGFDPSSSDTQVTVNRTLGKDAVQEGNRTYASGANWVQAHCIYQSERGLVRNNTSIGARFGYYGDWDSTKGVAIVGNSFKGCEHGVQLNLSPTPKPLCDTFSHEDYEIGENDIESSGAQVSLNTWGPSTSTRYIRNIAVDPSLSVESFGAEWHRMECAA